jgi:DNA-binding SARP family transcriptional activator
MNVELRLFGGLSLFAEGELVSGAAAQPRRLAVLAVLADAWPAAVTRDRLVGLIWPEQDESAAKRSLTQALYELRRELGEITRVSGRDLALDAEIVRTDLVEFRRAIQAGEWESAATIHRGPFLDGFYLRDGSEFERWLAGLRDQLHRDAVSATERASLARESAGDFRGAIHWAERCCVLLPFESNAVLRVIDLAVKSGDLASAKKAADDYAERMRRDLGVRPDPEVVRRVECLLGGSMAASKAPVPVEAPASVAPTPAAQRQTVSSQPQRRSRRAWVLTGATAVVLAGVTAMVSQSARRADRSRARVVHVLPFERRGEQNATPLGEAVRAALVATLDGSGGARADTTEHGGAWADLRGAVTGAGGEIRLDAALTLAGSAAPIRVSVAGPRDSLVSLTEKMSLELLPALYPELRQAPGVDFARRFRRFAVARRYLDGELALHRGAFPDAFRAFSEATELDPTAAYAWYRRAVAAEDAHQIADADRSALLADQLSDGLAPRDRGLIHAYAVWRGGDTRAADSLYRSLLASQPNDAELWYHFAEVSYHGGPVIGRPLDAALDAWRRATALDSASFPATMHLLRLEARAGNLAVLRALMKRVEGMNPGEPLLSEVRAVAAAAEVVARNGTYDSRQFDRMPDASAHFVHSVVAGMLERPDLARVPATALIAPARPAATRAEGFTALAHIAVARGQLSLANAMLDSLARLEPSAAAAWRAYFGTLPFVPAGVFASSPSIDGKSSLSASSAPLFLELALVASTAEIVRTYTAALKQVDDAQLPCERHDIAARDLCADLERGLRAEGLTARGDSARALAILDSLSLRVPYQLAGRSVFYARTRERFRRAQLLARAGRHVEAYAWFAATPHAARFDYIYLAPAHLGQAKIREVQGDREGALEHYRRAVDLWRDCDSLLVPARRDAELAIERLGGSRDR